MKNKKSKKIMIVGAMAALLTLIGVTGSETYAKYVESTTVPSQTATVAKWGFVQTVTANKLFGENYGAATDKLAQTTDTIDAEGNVTENGAIVTAAASGDYNIVQPGGSGYLTFSVTGSAEVPARFEFNAKAISEVALSNGGETYNPIEWRYVVTNKTVTPSTVVGSIDYTSFTSFANQLDSIVIECNPNSSVDIEVKVEWRWLFEQNKDTSVPNVFESGVLNTDEADTLLGILANKAGSLQYSYTDIALHYSANTLMDIELSMTATQIQ